MMTNMADDSGPTQAISPNSDGGNDEKEKEKRMSDLMQVLRMRGTHRRSWDDTIKALRSHTDKRHASEVMLQQYLDTLQKACRVDSLVLMMERLEMLARHVGMQYSADKVNMSVQLTQDLLHVEVLLEPTGVAKDVRYKLLQDFQSCPEMVTALNEGDFDEFQKHIEGLLAIQIGHDKKLRNKCILALQALETDLNTLVQYQSSITGTSNYIHKSPLGIVQPRTGGHALKMTYFVHPYDLLDESSPGKRRELTVPTVLQHKLGCSCSVGIETSTPHKLQGIPLLGCFKSQDGKNLPSFAHTSNQTSNQVPAVFVLILSKPTPLSLSVIRKIKNTTGIDVPMVSKTMPILQHLINQNCKNKKQSPSKGLFVTVPDQNHCYFVNGSNDSDDLQGAIVAKIPFAHPANVAKILAYLRQQMLFNTVLSSCVRSNPRQELDSSMTFEVTPLSLQHITVTFEHPASDSIATAEFNLSEITNVQCQIRSTDEKSIICPDNFACKVVQKCLSLPVTMRAILKKATADLGLVMVQSPVPTVPITPRTLSKMGQDHRLAFMDSHSQYVSQGSLKSFKSQHSEQETVNAITAGYMDPSKAPSEVLEAYKADKIHRNPMLARLLDGSENNSANMDPTPPSMLSALLGDQPDIPPPAVKQRRARKRRSVNDQRSPGSLAKSPKRRVLEDDMGSSSNLSSVEVSPSPSTHGFEPSPSHGSGVTTPVTATTTLAGLVADDSYMQESPVTKLASSMDSFIKQESKNLPNTHPNEGFGVNDISTMRLKDEFKHDDLVPRRKSTGSSLAELLENSPKCDPQNNVFFPSKDRSNSTSDLSSSSLTIKTSNDIKQEKSSPYDFKPDPIMNDISYSGSKLKSEQQGSTVYNHERHFSSSSSKSEKVNSAVWESKTESGFKSEEKSKEKNKRDKKDSMDEKPPEREKITVKLNTKELTAKTSVKEPRSSPLQDGVELTKSHSREGKSSKDSKSNREKVYDLPSDNILTPSLVMTRPLLADGRSGSPSTIKIKKIRSEDGKGEKKRKSSKHEGDTLKRKKDERNKKDKSKKMKYSVESDLGDKSSDRYAAVEKGPTPTTIKITTTKMPSSSKLSSPVKSSKSLSSSSSSGLKAIKSDRLSVSPQTSKSKSSLKTFNRSKSESQAISYNRAGFDSKLSRTPTIKLKPVVIPNSATSINVSSSKGSSSPGSAPAKSALDQSKSKTSGPKARKHQLDAIVDKLKTKQGNTPGSGLPFRSRGDGGEKKDAVTMRNELDEVRKAIIQQGIKPNPATKELTSYKAGPSMRPSKLSIDSNKRPDMKGSSTPTNPIPKINQNATKSSPASGASKLGTIPKTSSSSNNSADYSNAKGNSASTGMTNSNASNSSDYANRDTSGNRNSSQKSEGSRSKSSSSSGHGPPDSARTENSSDSKRELKENSASSTPSAFPSTTVSFSHGNNSSTSLSTSSAVAPNMQSPSHTMAMSSSPAVNTPSSSLSASSTTGTSVTSSNASTCSTAAKDQGKDSDKNRKRSVDDISERLHTRHFLDAVTKMEDGTEEEKKGPNKSGSDGRGEYSDMPDKVRPNGYNKSDRLSESWTKEDGRSEGSEGSNSSINRNCIDSPAPRSNTPTRGERRAHVSSEDKENSVGREDDSVFRAPTPKGSKSGLEVTEDRLEPRARSDSRTKPVLSPRSDISSPEDGLIIDCPGTPKSVRSPSSNRPDKTVSKPTTPANCSSESAHKNSSSCRTPQSPSPHKAKSSPNLSPATRSPALLQHSSPIQSPDANSQVDDDELMDAALIL